MKLTGMKGFIVYMVIISIITLPIFISTFFLYSEGGFFEQIQGIYMPFCHQLTSRSYCFFPEKGTVEDCYQSPELKSNKEFIVEKEGSIGYKFPVCSRDVGFYLFAFIGGIYLIARKKHRGTTIPDPWWLVLAIVPMAIDGGTQLIGLRESINILRFITGSIAGFALPLYLVPMLNKLIK